MTPAVTKSEVRSALADLGLGSGDFLAVHCSLKSFGHVDGGAMAVVEAVLETITQRGLVMMPALASTQDARGDLLPLNPATARITTGAIPAALTRHPAARRGLHPLYSIVFAGAGADTWARENERLMFPYGAEQQYSLLLGASEATGLEARGFILLIGVGDNRNSTIHILEELCNPAYLKEKKSQSRLTVADFFALSRDMQRESLIHHRAGPRRDFARVTPLLEAAGALRRAKVGGSVLSLEPARDLKRVFDKAMAEDPEFMVVKGTKRRDDDGIRT